MKKEYNFFFIQIVLFFFISSSISAQKILFVGNSLTYSNNLPKIVEFIAKKSGEKIITKSLCYPNYALVDHLHDGTFQKLMAKGKYDYVIVQQGPSSQSEGKKMLIEDGAIIEENAFVGARAIIKANTVVKANTIFAGRPASYFRDVKEEEAKFFRMGQEIYESFSADYIQELGSKKQ